MAGAEVTQGVLIVLFSALVLATLAPRFIGPVLRAAGDEDAVKALCAPSEWETRTLAVIAAAAIGAFAWTLSVLAGPDNFVWKLTAAAEPLASLLLVAGSVAGVVMLIGIGQRRVDRIFGRGFTSLVGLAAALSSFLVFVRGYDLIWLALWFPLCILIGWLTRQLEYAAWKITSAVAALLTAVVVLRHVGQFVGQLF